MLFWLSPLLFLGTRVPSAEAKSFAKPVRPKANLLFEVTILLPTQSRKLYKRRLPSKFIF
jgi:hypothetical protein